MPKRTNATNDASVQIRMPSAWVHALKMKSFERSLEVQDEIRWTDLVRSAIRNEFEFNGNPDDERRGEKCVQKE
jgi:hypothetical protein